MLNNELMFSSKSDEWETPDDLFFKLDSVFNFTLDPCATADNHKCNKYYTVDDDGLSKSWEGETVFVNPPYGNSIKHWVKKCYDESKRATIVMLIPARTDTSYQHNYIFNGAKAIVFIRGRLKFINRLLPSYREDKNFKTTAAPFPSQLVVFAESITELQKKVLESYGKFILFDREISNDEGI